MCKGYKWMLRYSRFDKAGKYNPIHDEWHATLAEARKAVRSRGPMDRSPDEWDGNTIPAAMGVIAEAVPICDVPPMRTPRGVEVHYFRQDGSGVREFV